MTNPSLYAFNVAKNLYGYEDVRILSLGSTHKSFELVKEDDFTESLKYADGGAMSKAMMGYTNDYFLDYNNYWKQYTLDNGTKVWRLSNEFYRVDGTSTVTANGQAQEA